MKYLLYLALCSSITSSVSSASKILFAAETANLSDYQAFLNTEPNYISFEQYYKKNSMSPQAIKTLVTELKRAQTLFLKGQEKLAIQSFQKVTDLAYQQDWSLQYRKDIFYSFLRRSQMETTELQKLLTQAIAFDSELSPEADIFPPPFITEFNKIKSQLKWKNFVFPASWMRAHSVYVNGKRLKLQMGCQLKLIDHPDIAYRWTFVSNRYFKFSKITKEKKPIAIPISFKAIAKGQCLKASLRSKQHIYFNDDCIYPKHSSLPSPLHPSRIKPKLTLNSVKVEKPRHALLNNKWFWIGVSGVVGTIIYSNNQRKPKAKATTTHQEGF